MKILVAIDGSENSLRAARYAAKTAAHFPGSKVSLVYVDTMSVQVKVKGGGILPIMKNWSTRGGKPSGRSGKIFLKARFPIMSRSWKATTLPGQFVISHGNTITTRLLWEPGVWETSKV